MTLVYGFIIERKKSCKLFESGALFFDIDDLMTSIGSALKRASENGILVRVEITVDDL